MRKLYMCLFIGELYVYAVFLENKYYSFFV